MPTGFSASPPKLVRPPRNSCRVRIPDTKKPIARGTAWVRCAMGKIHYESAKREVVERGPGATRRREVKSIRKPKNQEESFDQRQKGAKTRQLEEKRAVEPQPTDTGSHPLQEQLACHPLQERTGAEITRTFPSLTTRSHSNTRERAGPRRWQPCRGATELQRNFCSLCGCM